MDLLHGRGFRCDQWNKGANLDDGHKVEHRSKTCNPFEGGPRSPPLAETNAYQILWQIHTANPDHLQIGRTPCYIRYRIRKFSLGRFVHNHRLGRAINAPPALSSPDYCCCC